MAHDCSQAVPVMGLEVQETGVCLNSLVKLAWLVLVSPDLLNLATF